MQAVEEKSEQAEKLEKKIEERMEQSEMAEKEKSERSERNIMGIVYIYATYNNTIIHLTDMAGNTISQVSGGKVTKHSRLKATPTVAMFGAKRIVEAARDIGINSVFVRIRSKAGSTAPGPGANAAVKSLSREGLKIINILDTTSVPRGGPKPKGGKRGRRV
jgi:small subunit ribosomal protein S11